MALTFHSHCRKKQATGTLPEGLHPTHGIHSCSEKSEPLRRSLSSTLLYNSVRLSIIQKCGVLSLNSFGTDVWSQFPEVVVDVSDMVYSFFPDLWVALGTRPKPGMDKRFVVHFPFRRPAQFY